MSDATWEKPKTDWFGKINEDGDYEGDRFNAGDFNRIKNNLTYVYLLSLELYPLYDIAAAGADKVVGDYLYADDMNTQVARLNDINKNTRKLPIPNIQRYSFNGRTMNYTELITIEIFTELLKNQMQSAYEGRRKFTWNFGMKGTL